jgi:hypothetical protein
VGFKMATVASYDSHYPNVKFWPDRQYESCFLGGSPVFRQDTYLDFDALMGFSHKCYSTSAGMVIAMPGKGAQYMMATGIVTAISSRVAKATACTFPPTFRS